MEMSQVLYENMKANKNQRLDQSECLESNKLESSCRMKVCVPTLQAAQKETWIP